jgi:type II secretory pathway component PulK
MKRWNRRGSAVVAAMIALTILICLSGTLAILLRTETDSSQNFLEGIAAQWLAEAGLRRAIVVLYKNGNPQGLAETLNRDGWTGSYRITTSAEGTALRLRSSGRVGAAARSISVLVSLTLNPRPDEPLTTLTVLSWDN